MKKYEYEQRGYQNFSICINFLHIQNEGRFSITNAVQVLVWM